MHEVAGRVRRGRAALRATGVAVTVLLGSVLLGGAPAWADGTSSAQRVADGGAGVTQALVVGGLAFALIVCAAGAVLWFTMRRRGATHSADRQG